MNHLARAGHAYWQWHERIWLHVRRLDQPILILAAVGSIIAWAHGVDTGNVPLMWTPAAYGTLWWAANWWAR